MSWSLKSTHVCGGPTRKEVAPSGREGGREPSCCPASTSPPSHQSQSESGTPSTRLLVLLLCCLPFGHLSPPSHCPQALQLPWIVSFLIFLDVEGCHCSPDMNPSLGNYPRNEQLGGPLVWSRPHMGLLWTRKGQPSRLREQGAGEHPNPALTPKQEQYSIILQYLLRSVLSRQTSWTKSQLHQ